MSNDELINKNKYFDPDPITIAALVAAVVAAATGVGALALNLKNAAEKNKMKRRRIKAILMEMKIVGASLKEDLEEFGKIFKPVYVMKNGKGYFEWNITHYERITLNHMLNRIISSYKRLQDIQNRFGDLELSELGDKWRLHSIDKSTELFKVLSGIQHSDELIQYQKVLVEKVKDYLSDVKTALNYYDYL